MNKQTIDHFTVCRRWYQKCRGIQITVIPLGESFRQELINKSVACFGYEQNFDQEFLHHNFQSM